MITQKTVSFNGNQPHLPNGFQHIFGSKNTTNKVAFLNNGELPSEDEKQIIRK